MIKAIFFDLGGTLLFYNGEGLTHRLSKILNRSMEEILPFADTYLRTIKGDRQELLRAFCSALNINYHPNLEKEIFDQVSQINLNKNTISILEKLRYKYKLGVISNSCCHEALDLSEIGLSHFFSVIILSYEVGIVKPNIEIFRLAERNIACKPDELVYVGDSYISDVIGPKKAGWFSILYVPDGDIEKKHKNGCYKPDFVVTDLDVIPDIIENI